MTVSSDLKVNGCDIQTIGMHGKADPLSVKEKAPLSLQRGVATLIYLCEGGRHDQC